MNKLGLEITAFHDDGNGSHELALDVCKIPRVNQNIKPTQTSNPDLSDLHEKRSLEPRQSAANRFASPVSSSASGANYDSETSLKNTRPLKYLNTESTDGINDPLSAYFSRIPSYQSLSVDVEENLVKNLAESREKLLSVLGEFPGSAQWLLFQNSSQNANNKLSAETASVLFVNQSVNNDRMSNARAKHGAVVENRAGIPSARLSAGLDSENETTDEISGRLAILKKRHDELLWASAHHGLNHPLCKARRQRLASEFCKNHVSAKSIFRLVRLLFSLEQTIAASGEPLGNGGRDRIRINNLSFEKRFCIGVNDFEHIVRKTKPLIKQWQLARNALVKVHLSFVVYLARQYPTSNADLIDLIQEGNLGLIKAVERFDHRLGFKFSTYASHWIRSCISRFIAQSRHTVRLPYRHNGRLGSITRKVLLFKQSNGRYPTEAELAQYAGMTTTKLRSLWQWSQINPNLFLFSSSDETECPDLLSTLEQHVFPQPEEEASRQSLKDMVERSISALNQREAYIVRQRFGIGTDTEHTLQELGDLLGLTRERVRQIEAKALKKLKRRILTCRNRVS